MKKSTILLLVLVYVVAFFAIALFGHSIRGYNVIVEPESIELIDPDGQTELTKDIKDPETGEKLHDYHFVFKNYTSSKKMRIKATVLPANTDYPNVVFSKDESTTTFNLLTHDRNPEIEENFCEITLNKELEPRKTLTTRIYINSTNPGVQIKLVAVVVFVGA